MPKKIARFWLLMFFSFVQDVYAQSRVDFSQLLYGYIGYYPKYEAMSEVGLGYIPKLSAEAPIDSLHGFKMEASLTLGATAKFREFVEVNGNVNVRPYRVWIRYATPQIEIRAGLQSIEFGSAQFLRPLQWFDKKDRSDPLQLSGGVYGLLGRYYFPNNANVWVWGLYGNKQLGLQDLLPVNPKHPGLGGRFQMPIPKGEAAITFNRSTFRQEVITQNSPIVHENRFGIDAKADLGVGLWVEAAWSALSHLAESVKSRRLLTVGADYTFGLGNGLTIQTEQMFSSYGGSHKNWEHPDTIGLISAQYPMTLSDQVGLLLYRQWKAEKNYFVAQYRHDFRRWTVFIIGFLRPFEPDIMSKNDVITTITGSGIRILLMYHY